MSKLPEHVKNILLIFSLHELLVLGTALIPYPHSSLWLLSHTNNFSSHAVLWFL